MIVSFATRFRPSFAFLWILLCSAPLTFGASCKSKTATDTRMSDSGRARHIRVDSGAEPMSDVARLYSLYLPGAPVVDDTSRLVQADAQGLVFVRETIAANECVDVLIDVPQEDAHPAFVGLFALLPQHTQVMNSVAETGHQQLLAYDTQDASAWIMPHVCPEETTRVQLVLRGQPRQEYQLQVQRTASDAVDRALYAQAHRDLPGFRGYGPLQRDVLQNNARISLPLAVSREHCIAIAAYAEAGLDDLDARFLDLHGDLLALEVATDHASILGPYCPLDDEIIRVEFRAYKGQGAFRWQRWESDIDIGNQLVDARIQSKDGKMSDTTQRAIIDQVLRALHAKD